MSTVINIIMILSSIALLLPVFSGYVLAFSMLVSQSLPFWRIYKRSRAGVRDPGSLFVWSWGRPICILLAGFVIATVAAGLRDGGGSWRLANQFLGNSIVKYGLLWLFVANFILIAVRDFRAIALLGKCLPWVTGLHFLYCLGQRYYGIDWVHGFHGVLPENRFAYGVYRVSGFTSHPLTIGYQLCLVMNFCIALAVSPRSELVLKRQAAMGGVFCWLTILISGSRGPLLVSTAILLWMIVPFISSKAKMLAVLATAGVAAVAVVFVIPGTIDRFLEAFTTTSGDTRLVDLKVYSAAFADHPFVGLGNLDIGMAISAYYRRFGGDDNIGLAHNMYLQVAAETGLIGLLSFLQWIAAWPIAARRLMDPKERWSFYGISLVMILSGVTQNSLRDSGVVLTLTFVTIALGSYFSGDADLRDEHESRTKHQNIKSGASA